MKVTTTVGKAYKALMKLSKQRVLENGQQREVKPDILNARGDAGVNIYFVKHGIKDSCGAYFEKIDDLREDMRDAKEKEFKELQQELDNLAEEEVEIEIPAKLNIDEIKSHADVDDLEALAFAINFDK